MKITLTPIGFVRHNEKKVPRHWTISDIEGDIIVERQFLEGLQNITSGDRISVIFHFHNSEPFNITNLIQHPPHHKGEKGVFSTCSPLRPNPIGLSILHVLNIKENIISVKGLDMVDGTPVLDIKPYIKDTV